MKKLLSILLVATMLLCGCSKPVQEVVTTKEITAEETTTQKQVSTEDIQGYFTKDKFAFGLPVSYALGDYLIFEMSYSDLYGNSRFYEKTE